MDQCFKITLWMCLLLGPLQAKPIHSTSPGCMLDLDDLDFTQLGDISCKNMTFTSPTTVEGECNAAALDLYINGLKRAETHCTGDVELIGRSAEAMSFYKECLQQTKCNFTMTVHKQFGSFVTATKSFLEGANYYHG